MWKEGNARSTEIPDPYVLGHECAGEIVSIGAGVSNWMCGDRIAIKPAAPCLE